MNAKLYVTHSCSVCDTQGCEGDITCDECGRDMDEVTDFWCKDGEHYCPDCGEDRGDLDEDAEENN